MRRAAGPKSTGNVECFFRALPTQATWVGREKGAAQRRFFTVFTVRVQKISANKGPPTQLTWEPICWAGGCRVACCHLGDSRMVLVCWQSTFACAVSVLRVRVPAPVNLLGPAE